jgi:hypothetical protein
VTKNVTLKQREVTQWGNGHSVNSGSIGNNEGRREKNFNGEAALLFRACFHIEGDWRPFEDGILWENEEPPHPLKFYI